MANTVNTPVTYTPTGPVASPGKSDDELERTADLMGKLLQVSKDEVDGSDST